ncbi:hypothetical protein CISIN_1g026898mg [Citrus sinensis]|uniref:Uncharacterized protein n=1 Tax=Citrus sinensis TaxID=2711 RepID=A0A067EJ16_CITSI|nr:hypothetical protein CISIN_1g026898mg [Citrus sinensis]
MTSPAMAGGHPATSLEFPLLPSFAQMAAKPPTAQPCKSFVDVTIGSQRADPAIAFKQSSTHRGEPKADNKNQNAATNEASTQSAQDTSTVASLVVHDVRTTNAETSEAPNGVTTTEATHVISSDPPAVADVPPPSTVTLPSVVRASPERTCTDLVPIVGEMDSGFGTPVVTAASSMATTSTPAGALGLLSSYLNPYMRIIGDGFSSPDASYDDAPLCTLNTQCTDLPKTLR